MPLIKPKKYENQKDFIVRCIGNGKMASEYKDCRPKNGGMLHHLERELQSKKIVVYIKNSIIFA